MWVHFVREGVGGYITSQAGSLDRAWIRTVWIEA